MKQRFYKCKRRVEKLGFPVGRGLTEHLGQGDREGPGRNPSPASPLFP